MPLRTTAFVVFIALVLAACASDSVDDAEAGESSTTVAAVETADPGVEPSDTETTESSPAETSEATEPEDTGGTPPLGEQFGAITVVGDALEPMPQRIPVTEPENDPAIGQVAPEITGTNFADETVEILADGTPKVIMFVAHWCPHCQREVPAVTELIEAGAVPEGLELIIVSTVVRDGEENFPPQTWLQNESWPGPVMRDSESFDALLAFGAGGFPFSVYLNSDHEVVTRSAGEIPSDILEQLWLATATD